MNLTKPLRCTAFEELMLAQDSPQYPCVIVCRMQVHGKITRDWFERSVEQMLYRHPLFRAQRQSWLGRSRWEIQPEPRCKIDWLPNPEDSTWAEETYVDLRKDECFHITVEEQGDDSTIFFRVHHAMVDGLGLLNALHDMWTIYDSLALGSSPKLPQLDTEALPNRNHFGMTWRKILEIIPRQMIGLAGVRQFVMRNPVPLVAHSPFWGRTAAPLPVEVVIHRFDQSISTSIGAAAKRLKVNLNDLLAACIFAGCEASRASWGEQSDTDWLRMMVPVSMRSSKMDYQQTACNIVSSVFLDRTPVQIRDRKYLLDSIHKEMELIKKNRLALMFILSLWLRKITLFRSRTVPPPAKCPVSFVFTNLGKVFFRSALRDERQRIVAGGVVVETIDAVAPLTPYMSAAFSAIQYGKRLSLSLRYDPRVIQRHQAESLIATIVAELNHHATLNGSEQNLLTSANTIETDAI